MNENAILPVKGMNDILAVGRFIAQSGMFGVNNEAEGFVIASACHHERISLMEFKETYNIIHGTPSMRSDAMLSRFVSRGGRYKIISRTPDLAAIRTFFMDDENEFSLSWEEALQEPFPYNGKESDVLELLAAGKTPSLRAKYRTPRSRMQMLWARVVSDAIRAVDPTAVKGTYTPEEVSDFTDKTPARPAAPGEFIDVSATESATEPPDNEFVIPESVCPIDDPEFHGKQWSELNSDLLNFALESTNPAITEGHKEVIAKILNDRGL